jgi:hypothetical protein
MSALRHKQSFAFDVENGYTSNIKRFQISGVAGDLQMGAVGSEKTLTGAVTSSEVISDCGVF